MDGQNVFEWLWLISCTGCGSNRTWEIMARFENISEAYRELHKPERRKGILTQNEMRNAERTSDEQINELVSYCEGHGIYILTCDDPLYPNRLRAVYNPPAVLFCRGRIECLANEYSISVVGTRNPSEYSERVAKALVRELSSFGMTIVSGFAVGIDIAANLTAAKSGGRTIAVLGCGLDYDYPKENSCYRKEIEENGLFVSEYFPKASGSRHSFPARNRILSALSLGTVVIEAGEKSGSLSTARCAVSQGKDIFVIAPHDLFDRRYGGNVALIRDGAKCLCGVKDIVDEYYENKGHKIANAPVSVAAELPGEKHGAAYRQASLINPYKESETPKRKIAATVKSVSVKKKEFDTSLLSEEGARVYEILRQAGRPLRADEIEEQCGMDTSELLSLLTDLEIDGAVKSAAGQSYTVS